MFPRPGRSIAGIGYERVDSGTDKTQRNRRQRVAGLDHRLPLFIALDVAGLLFDFPHHVRVAVIGGDQEGRPSFVDSTFDPPDTLVDHLHGAAPPPPENPCVRPYRRWRSWPARNGGRDSRDRESPRHRPPGLSFQVVRRKALCCFESSTQSSNEASNFSELLPFQK